MAEAVNYQVQQTAYEQCLKHDYFTTKRVGNELLIDSGYVGWVFNEMNCADHITNGVGQVQKEGRAPKWGIKLDRQKCTGCYFNNPHANACYMRVNVTF